MKKDFPYLKWFKLLGMALFVGALVYFPVLYRYLKHGIVYSGRYDGIKQMVPFQKFLYERMASFSSFYDVGFGLGGDYFTDLTYYYTTSPMMYLNFLSIKVVETLGLVDPTNIDFWATNQLVVAYFKCALTFLATYGMLKMFKIEKPYRFVGAMLYSASTVFYFFNFAWSFFGDVMLYLPLAIWGMERFFKQRKIGLFIIAIALTLFSNFYFSYYLALALAAYLIYRMIDKHPDDVVTRWKKLWLLCPAVIISLCVASLGFLTGVRAFLNNDRKLVDFEVPFLIDFSPDYHIFSNGLHFTITFIALVALFTFKLYRHYYYRLFAIFTWILLIGSLSQYTDSLFNGLSFPERRWGFLLVMSTSVLIALWLKHLAELTWRSYLISLLPLVPLAIATVNLSSGRMWWMVASALILCLVAYCIVARQSFSQKMMYIIIGLFIAQQFLLVWNYRTNNMMRYETTLETLHSPDYHSDVLQHKIDKITDKQSPMERIDYISNFAVNTSMLYNFNGVALYSSIFDGAILEYYDKLMQVNMGYDSNSYYRTFGDRANMFALWGVTDRIRKGDDNSIPYGMERQEKFSDRGVTWIRSHNTFDYPAAHLTSKVFDASDLKSPLDREHAMLEGVVLDGEKANTPFYANPNLVKFADITPRDAKQQGFQLTVSKDLGGLDISMPPDLLAKYKDYYLEMDVELLYPNTPHYLIVDNFYQERRELTQRYRRFVTPVTVRVSANEPMQLKLKKGTYRVNIKGIYGEDYTTLEKAQNDVKPVKVTRNKRNIRVDMKPTKKSYLVLPMPYRDGLKAEVDGEARGVEKGNGLQTVIPVNKGEKEVILHYELPHWRVYLVLTLLGVIGAIIYRKWLRRNS
ncbi:YfhO family protein [Staphylococcus americanisciuri]|uniref:YfhO family protein n=1 Tax=Staphylococcus americanisciuri TaxID=2973940 RepID=A0ABT2F2D6_9STAP|nr:YfhO family protein [Staphylococcus americanisciuri]MCS4486577.1 YfhO family protein [Staphylococcus americanisciuri]